MLDVYFQLERIGPIERKKGSDYIGIFNNPIFKRPYLLNDVERVLT
jgi:hypothetical protein